MQTLHTLTTINNYYQKQTGTLKLSLETVRRQMQFKLAGGGGAGGAGAAGGAGEGAAGSAGSAGSAGPAGAAAGGGPAPSGLSLELKKAGVTGGAGAAGAPGGGMGPGGMGGGAAVGQTISESDDSTAKLLAAARAALRGTGDDSGAAAKAEVRCGALI
jgi:hypothetical protein